MVYCDECGFEFKMHMHTEAVDEDIHRHYLKCPNCNAEYHGFYTNTKARDLYQKALETNSERYKEQYVQALKTLNFDGKSKH